MAANNETLSSGTTTSGHILGDLSLTLIVRRNFDSSSSSSSSSSFSPFGSIQFDAHTLLQDPDFLSELISLNQSMHEGFHMTKNDLREMSKVVDQLIGKTDFTNPDSVGEMVTEALTNLESEVWPNMMEFVKGIHQHPIHCKKLTNFFERFTNRID